MNDDHGDQFPGALPARTASAPTCPAGATQRLVRMRSARVRPAAATRSRMVSGTRRSLQRFDSYTLDVFNPGPPFRQHGGR
jgi:hypothetical protein